MTTPKHGPLHDFQDPLLKFPGLRYGARQYSHKWGGALGFLCASSLVGFLVLMDNMKMNKMNELERSMEDEAVIPFLQAESDLKYVAWKLQNDAEESDYMKDVPDWKVGESAYNSKQRWVPPVAKV